MRIAACLALSTRRTASTTVYNIMESSISLEETNKIRIGLGLKPLVDDGAPVDVKEKAAEDNYAETREREKSEKRTRFVRHFSVFQDSKELMSILLHFHMLYDSEIKARIEK